MKNKCDWNESPGCDIDAAHSTDECYKPTHAPTPWKVSGQRIFDDNGVLSAQCLGFKSFMPKEQAEANAVFIVKAVNNYESMLDALKSVDLSDVKSIARVKVQNAILKAEGL